MKKIIKINVSVFFVSYYHCYNYFSTVRDYYLLPERRAIETHMRYKRFMLIMTLKGRLTITRRFIWYTCWTVMNSAILFIYSFYLPHASITVRNRFLPGPLWISWSCQPRWYYEWHHNFKTIPTNNILQKRLNFFCPMLTSSLHNMLTASKLSMNKKKICVYAYLFAIYR